MNKFLNLVLGTNDVPTYLTGLFFAMLGVGVILLLKTSKRDKESQNTPHAFSFKSLFLVKFNTYSTLKTN